MRSAFTAAPRRRRRRRRGRRSLSGCSARPSPGWPSGRPAGPVWVAIPARLRSRAMPILGECPEKPAPSPARRAARRGAVDRALAERLPRLARRGEDGSTWAGAAGTDRLDRVERSGPDVDDRAAALLVALRAADGEPPRAVAGRLDVGPGERGRLRAAEQRVTHRPAERELRAAPRRGRGARRDRGQGRLGERPRLPLRAACGLPPEPGRGAPHTFAAGRVGLAGGAVRCRDRGEGHPAIEVEAPEPAAARSVRYSPPNMLGAARGGSPYER